MAKAAIEAETETFIVFGSQAEANPSDNLIKEEILRECDSIYGQTKSNLSLKLHSAFEGKSTRLVWARIFSVYGPKDHEDSLVSIAIEHARRNKALTINAPTRIWSFLYISDFVKAIESIICNIGIESVVNIGNPNLFKLQDLAEMISGEFRFSQDAMDSKSYIPELSKLGNIGWGPKVALQTGINITKEWAEVNLPL